MEPKKKRLSKRSIRALAWGAGASAFVLPWAVVQLAPTTTGAQGQQVIVVPAGSRVVLSRSAGGSTGVKVIRGKATATATPVTTTRASAPPPRI